MPGSTRAPFASEAFRGKSKNGPWGDSIEELDWSTGEILKALKKHGLDEKTLVLWTSDNGAPRRNPPQGSNGSLGGWGYTTAEGGMRVPAIVRWPGFIPVGSSSDELGTLMDLLPTFVKLAGAKLPDRKIDGKNIWPLWNQPDAKTPHKFFYYYHTQYLEAVRDVRWKLVLPHAQNRTLRRGVKHIDEPQLFDMKTDAAEMHDVAADHLDIVKRLLAAATTARKELGDGKVEGDGVRPVGHLKNPAPRVK